MKTFFKVVLIGSLFLSSISHAVTRPPEVSELCERAQVIVLADYKNVELSPVKDCRFTATYQLKPLKIYKISSRKNKTSLFKFRRNYYLNNSKCRMIPGPNSTPENERKRVLASKENPTMFFFEEDSDYFLRLVDVFWADVSWNEGNRTFQEEFKSAKKCKPTD